MVQNDKNQNIIIRGTHKNLILVDGQMYGSVNGLFILFQLQTVTHKMKWIVLSEAFISILLGQGRLQKSTNYADAGCR